jgi:GT2 family glycosyltransferase
MNRFAVVLTHNRPVQLAQCVAAIGPQVDMVIVIDNASTPPVRNRESIRSYIDPAAWPEPGEFALAVVHVADQPPNISRFWNLGIDKALEIFEAGGEARERPFVAVLCDDALPPAGWFAAVTAAMCETGAVIGASSHGGIGEHIVKRERDSDLARRMPGHAWIIDPASTVRADERFAYWWGDTDLDIQARQAGGMVVVGGYPVVNQIPDGHTNLMAAQVALDSQAFVDKYDGWKPWL